MERKLTRGLGWFSLALGAPQITMPGRMNRLIGVRDDERSRFWQRVVGVGEIGVGAALLGRPRPVPEHERARRVKAAITVRRPRDDVYRFWRDFQNLPRFMAHLESVQPSGDGRSHWKATAPAGRTVEWDAELVDDRTNELIAWRSLPGAKVQHRGKVRFADAPGERGTEIRLEIEYDPPGGPLGATLAKLSGAEPGIQVKDDLRRFKQVMETGVVVRSEGTPEGPLARRLIKQRPAQPLQPGEKVEVSAP